MRSFRGTLRPVLEVVAVLPLFLVTPLLRRRHLSWGATEEEVAASMPGDELVPVSHFTPTRAITIDARPEQVWPWLLQVGYRRAGFYSYDLLDNLGAKSSDRILEEWQELRVGDVAAPMTEPPTAATSFVLAAREENRSLLWAKPDSTWAWKLVPLEGERTRLVTRVRQRYAPKPSTILTIILMEFGDFAMMRKMLHGIKQRAERHDAG